MTATPAVGSEEWPGHVVLVCARLDARHRRWVGALLALYGAEGAPHSLQQGPTGIRKLASRADLTCHGTWRTTPRLVGCGALAVVAHRGKKRCHHP